jgi:AcrB/AcrD/AcrF family
MVAALVRIALKRPYTFIVLAILIALFGTLAATSMATDIFPDIDIPVVAVAWTYTGLAPDDMAGRVIYYYERQLSLAVDDIENILSSRRRYPYRNGAGDVCLADRAKADAARNHPAFDCQLQRRYRADPPTRPIQRHAGREGHL